MIEVKLVNNVKYYWLYETTMNLGLMSPIYTLMMIAKGLSFAEIMIVQSMYTLACTIFDVYSGILADKLGRRKTLIMGQFLEMFSLFTWVLLDGFWPALILKVIYGIGRTFKSGPDISILYETLKRVRREDTFRKVKGRADSIMYIFTAVECLIAGFLFSIHYNLPLFICALISVVNMFVILSFGEPTRIKDKCKIRYFQALKNDAKYILENKIVFKYIIFGAIYFLFMRFGYLHFSIYLENLNFPIKYVGIVFLIMNLLISYVTNHTDKIYEIFKNKTLDIYMGLMLLSLIMFATNNIYIVILAFMLHQAFKSNTGITLQKMINDEIPNEKRSGILSFKTMIMNLVFAVTAPYFGGLAKTISIPDMFKIYTVLLLVLYTFYKIVFKDAKTVKLRRETEII